MLLWKALVLFLVYILLNVFLIFVELFKKGKMVKNTVIFSAIEVYIILISVLTMIYRLDSKLEGYLISLLLIVAAVGAIVIRKLDYFISRILTVELIVLSNISFWYPEYHENLLIVSLFVIGTTLGGRYYLKTRKY